MAIYSPACPFCQSTVTSADPHVRGNKWRENLAMTLTLLGAVSVKIYMRCDECGKAFYARGSRGFPIENPSEQCP